MPSHVRCGRRRYIVTVPPSSSPPRYRPVVRSELRKAPLEEPPLGLVVHERERTLVGVARLARATEAGQQLTSRRVQVVVVAQVEAIGDVEAGAGALRLGHRDGPSQLDDR